MRPLTGLFPTEDYPALIVGLGAPDDSAVYRLDAERAIISTVDFFPPVVDEPYAFGAIAAANALSDIYAMGGEPLFAVNLVAYPDGYGLEILSEILRGGGEKVREAGAAIAGGHTVTDKEPKYGLAVTGIIHPDRIITKGGALPGDQLVLTKPLGTGTITTALKNSRAHSDHIDAAIASMSQLNRDAARLAQQFGVRAMTDITGYSLLGHGHEIAHLGGVNLRIQYNALPWLPGAQTYGEQDIFPGGMWRNREYFEQWIQFDGSFADYEVNLLFDPQTSGGLLMAVPADHLTELLAQLEAVGTAASHIGAVEPGSGGITVVR